MASPTLVGKSASNWSNGTTLSAVSVPLPAGQSGDWYVVEMCWGGDPGTITSLPAGTVALLAPAAFATDSFEYGYSALYAVPWSGATSVEFRWTNAQTGDAAIYQVRGGYQPTLYDAPGSRASHSATSGTGSAVQPSVSPVSKESMLLLLLTGNSGAQPASPSGMTAYGSRLSAYYSHSAYYEARSAIGSTGTRTWTTATGSYASGQMVVIPSRAPNSAPSAPGAFTSPTSTSTVNTTDPVEVGAATDPDGDTLSYEWDLSTDNGATWTRKRNLTAGVLWTYDYTAEPATTAALWRVRAHDGVVYGPYSTSPLFTVAHNQPPTAPTPTFPVGGRVLERAQPIELRATFNDPDAGDAPSQSQWRYRQVGAATWTTVTQSGTAQTYTIGATVLAAADYEWQALYYDRLGAVSPWSVSAFFTAGTVPPGPTITAPVDGGTVPQTTVVAWTSAAQDAFQARRVADNAGAPDPATVFYDSGVVEDPAARDHPLTFETNNRYEHVQVAVRSGGLWSPWVSARVLVSYTPPAVPAIRVTPNNDLAAIEVDVYNSTAWGYGGSASTKNAASPPLIDPSALGVERLLWLPGTAGNYVSTPDVNEIDYDSSTFETSLGNWQGLNRNLLTANQSSVETDTSGWAAVDNATIARSTAQALDGAASLAVTATAANVLTRAGTTATPVIGGQVYTALACVRAATTARSVVLSIDWYDAGSVYVSSSTGAAGADNPAGWRQVRVTAQAPANASTARLIVRLAADDVIDAGEVHYVDAVGLFETPNGNLVPNPDFENGTGGWVSGGNGGATITRSTAQAYTGATSALVTWPTGTAGTVTVQIEPFTTVAGLTYTASAYVYVPAGSPAVRLQLIAGDVSQVSAASTATNTWQRLTATFTATTASTLNFAVYAADTMTAGQQIYIDAVQVVVGSTPVDYVPPTTHNLVTNSSFELDTAGWTLPAGAVRSGSAGMVGAFGVRYTAPTALGAGAPLLTQAALYTGVAGTYTLSATVRGPAGAKLSINFEGVASGPEFTCDGTPQRVSVTRAVTAAQSWGVSVTTGVTTGALAAGAVVDIDAVQVEAGSVATPFVAGSLGAGYRWDAAENLLTAAASSFEDGTVGGWAAVAAGVLANSTTSPGSGTQSLAVTAPAPGDGASSPAMSGGAVTGTTYTLSLSLAGTAGDVVTVALAVAGTVYATRDVTLTAATARYTVTGTTTASGAHTVTVTRVSGTGAFYLDAVQVEQRSYPTAYAAPGTADASTSTRQAPWVLGGTAMEDEQPGLTRATTYASQGTASLFIDGNSSQAWRPPGTFRGAETTVPVQPTTTYTLSCWADGPSVAGVRVVDSATGVVLGVAQGAPATRWSVTFTTGSATTGVRVQAVQDVTGRSYSDLYIDAVQLERGSTATAYQMPLRITGDLDLRARVAMEDWTPSAETVLVGTGYGEGYALGLDTAGQLLLGVTVGGVAIYARSAALGLVDGDAKHVRATRSAATGEVRFYTSDDGATWAALGTPVASTPGAAAVAANPLRVGQVGGAAGVRGKLLSASVRAGIDGVVVGFYDATRHTAATYTDPVGKVWTVTRTGDATAEIVDRTAWAFTGTEFFELPDRNDLDVAVGEALALVAGFVPQSAVGSVLEKRVTGAAGGHYALYMQGGNVSDVQGDNDVYVPSRLHVYRVLIVDRDSTGLMTVRDDDGAVASRQSGPGALTNTAPLKIGGAAGQLTRWVALFRRALTAAERAALAAWDGAVTAEPTWLREDATLYLNVADSVQRVQYEQRNLVLNLARTQSEGGVATDLPVVTSTDILRRVGATGDGIRVAAGLLPDATWVDWTPASRVDYQYRAVVHAANGTSTDSGWAG